MCGIVGVVGNAPAAPLLVEALRRLEYRGYDSAGVATLVEGHIQRRRAEGKLVNPKFVDKAPANVVAQERVRLTNFKTTLAQIDAQLAKFGD